MRKSSSSAAGSKQLNTDTQGSGSQSTSQDSSRKRRRGDDLQQPPNSSNPTSQSQTLTPSASLSHRASKPAVNQSNSQSATQSDKLDDARDSDVVLHRSGTWFVPYQSEHSKWWQLGFLAPFEGDDNQIMCPVCHEVFVEMNETGTSSELADHVIRSSCTPALNRKLRELGFTEDFNSHAFDDDGSDVGVDDSHDDSAQLDDQPLSEGTRITLLIRFWVESGMHVKFVEDRSWRQLEAHLNPNVRPISQTELCTHIATLADISMKKVKQILSRYNSNQITIETTGFSNGDRKYQIVSAHVVNEEFDRLNLTLGVIYMGNSTASMQSKTDRIRHLLQNSFGIDISSANVVTNCNSEWNQTLRTLKAETVQTVDNSLAEATLTALSETVSFDQLCSTIRSAVSNIRGQLFPKFSFQHVQQETLKDLRAQYYEQLEIDEPNASVLESKLQEIEKLTAEFAEPLDQQLPIDIASEAQFLDYHGQSKQALVDMHLSQDILSRAEARFTRLTDAFENRIYVYSNGKFVFETRSIVDVELPTYYSLPSNVVDQAPEYRRALQSLIDVTSRWHAMYLMLFQFQKLLPICRAALSLTHPLDLRPQDISLLQSTLLVLKPIFEATSLLAAEKHCVISCTYPVMCKLVFELEKIPNDSNQPAFELRERLLRHIKERYFQNFDQIPVTTIVATMLDPRFKHLNWVQPNGFESPLAIHFRQRFVQFLVSQRRPRDSAPVAEPAALRPCYPSTSSTGDAFTFADCADVPTIPRKQRCYDNDAINLQRAEDDMLDFIYNIRGIPFQTESGESSDPLAWWSNFGRSEFPEFANFARMVFCIPIAEEPFERAFNNLAINLRSRNHQSNADLLNQTMFLYCNRRLLYDCEVELQDDQV